MTLFLQAIELAIELKLARVEAGAQGEHKLARGYVPTPTYSLHWIADRGLREAVRRYLQAETPAVIEEAEILTDHAPFKQRVSAPALRGRNRKWRGTPRP